MALDISLIKIFENITSRAALASYHFVGKKIRQLQIKPL